MYRTEPGHRRFSANGVRVSCSENHVVRAHTVPREVGVEEVQRRPSAKSGQSGVVVLGLQSRTPPAAEMNEGQRIHKVCLWGTWSPSQEDREYAAAPPPHCQIQRMLPHKEFIPEYP